MPAKTPKKETEIDILVVEKGEIEFYILGTSPLILNRMNEKVRQQLLLPSGRKTAADKASMLKHNPYEEFQSAPYLDPNEGGPSFLMGLSSWFKNAMRGAAVDLPKLSKAQIGRLVRVEGERVGIYGDPKMFLEPSRCADQNKTPDIHARVIVPEWCCKITVTYVKPLLREKHVANLLSFSGITQGVGDWRSEKGSGDHGCFEIVSKDDKRWKFLEKNYGRDFQKQAMEDADCYNRESQELYDWFKEEIVRRGHKNVRLSGLIDYSCNSLQTQPPA